MTRRALITLLALAITVAGVFYFVVFTKTIDESASDSVVEKRPTTETHYRPVPTLDSLPVAEEVEPIEARPFGEFVRDADPETTLRGRVVHEGRPVREFCVAAGAPVCVDSEDGSFAVEYKGMLRQAYIYSREHAPAKVSFSPGDGNVGTVELRAARKLSGLVLDPFGRPAAGAVVDLNLSYASPVDLSGRTVVTDEQGRFTITTFAGAQQLLVQHESGSIVANVPTSGEIVVRLAEGRGIEPRAALAAPTD